MGPLNNKNFFNIEQVWKTISELNSKYKREGSKKLVQQGRRRFDARSVRVST